jgi:8-oxo-dGTP diphosphatase
MLLRRNPPNRGLWNGVGGKIEKGETPRQAVLREINEETGLTPKSIRFAGVVTWEDAPETNRSGMYVYLAETEPNDTTLFGNRETDEGLLVWIEERHLFDFPVVSNIPFFLPSMLDGDKPIEHRFIYDEFGTFVYHRYDTVESKYSEALVEEVD